MLNTLSISQSPCCYRLQISLAVILALLLGCGDKDAVLLQSPPERSEVQLMTENVELQSYTDTGDLNALRKRGVIRLLAPKFDTTQELPRDGISVQAYQELAEEFVRSVGLEPQWVFVDSFDTLLTDLNEGRGDLVVTNLSVTPQREQSVAFSIALAVINEVLITQKDTVISSLDALAGITVSVPEGTAYQETLTKLKKKHPELTVDIKSGDFSDSQMLQQLASAEVTATVIDSDVADLLLPQHPSLVKGLVLKKHRKIAWAVRKDNLQLYRSLNEFLVAEHMQSARSKREHRDWEKIKADKKLRMLTLNNPSSYFMWRGELMGFDYDLMKKFSRQHQLRLEVIVKDDIDGLLMALEKGEGDVIASSLTVTDERIAQGLTFSRRYMQVREQLVSVDGVESISTVEELAGKRVAVNPQTAFFERLQNLKESGVDFEIISKPGVATETLIEGLSSGDYDFTVADSHLVAIEKSYRDDLHVNFDLTENVDIAWGLRADQSMLLDKLNAFIKKEYRGLFYNVTFKKYFVDSKNIQRHKKFRVVADGELSPFDKKVRQHAEEYSVDWRLITAQMYQESKFNPRAKSFAGAQGLMQVMPRTAKEFGFDNLHEPDNAIAAGLAYMDWLHGRFPGSMALDERLYFVLAAYNAGAGHVRDARGLAKQLGNNPNRWFDNVEDAMLLLSKPAYAKKARFGYVRGSEPVNYVRDIRDRYLGYLRVGSDN